MSHEIGFYPLSLIDLFCFKAVMVYSYEGDIILVVGVGDQNHLLHLFENEVDEETLYGLAVGRPATLPERPFFMGKPSSIEVSVFKSDTDWDFRSILLDDGEGSSLRIGRNNASLPEPTFSVVGELEGGAA